MGPATVPHGIAVSALPRLSPNFGERRGGLRPSLIVLHYTAMASCNTAYDRLCDPAAEVSAHYLISEGGEVLALVPEDMRAWHAGAGAWRGRDDINSQSIGIELANDGSQPFAAAQMRALEDLLGRVMARWAIGPEGVIAHSDIAPGRKVDPGTRFDWRRLALGGLSVWPQNAKLRPTFDFVNEARRFGYPDAGDDFVLAAFRLRFRPWAKGPLDDVDAGMMADLADRFGVASA
jgi:N-acetylmuramoyl-L-alanine amidase